MIVRLWLILRLLRLVALFTYRSYCDAVAVDGLDTYVMMLMKSLALGALFNVWYLITRQSDKTYRKKDPFFSLF